MLLCNTYSTTSHCEENFIEERIKENAPNNYLYYTFMALASITLLCTVYTVTAYYFPDIDILNLFNTRQDALPTTPNYGLQSIITHTTINDVDPIYYVGNKEAIIDKDVVDHLINTLKHYQQQNMILTEQNLNYQRQLDDLLNTFDFRSHLHNFRPQALDSVNIRRPSIYISSEDITSPIGSIFDGTTSRSNSFSSTSTETYNQLPTN